MSDEQPTRKGRGLRPGANYVHKPGSKGKSLALTL